MNRANILLNPPIRGYWTIYNPPGHSKLAFDFLATNESKSLYNRGNFLRHLVNWIPVEDTYTWDQTVYAPIDGTIVATLDSFPDRKQISFLYDLFSLLIHKPKVADGFGAFGGNHIMIKTREYYVLLCHLKANSVQVKVGDQVSMGDELARIGNSGSSIQPHLHLQVMSNDQYFPLFKNLLPFKINHAKIKSASGWIEGKNLDLKNRTHYLF